MCCDHRSVFGLYTETREQSTWGLRRDAKQRRRPRGMAVSVGSGNSRGRRRQKEHAGRFHVSGLRAGAWPPSADLRAKLNGVILPSFVQIKIES